MVKPEDLKKVAKSVSESAPARAAAAGMALALSVRVSTGISNPVALGAAFVIGAGMIQHDDAEV